MTSKKRCLSIQKKKKKKTLYYIYYVIYKLKIKEQSNNTKINLS